MPISMSNTGQFGLQTKLSPQRGIHAVSDSVGNGPADEAVKGLTLSAVGETPSPITVLIGAIGLLLVLKVIGELSETAIKPAHMSIGGYNILAVSVTAIVGIAILKLIFNRWQFPGITPLINFI